MHGSGYSAPVRRHRVHGIFCLEDDWFGIRDSSSIEPVLHLLNKCRYHVPYLHRNVATADAFTHYLKKWAQRSYDDYPILYLGFHGSPGTIHLSSGRGQRYEIGLDWLEERLQGKCRGRMIFFASCSTIDIHGRRLNRFLRRTGALAVCGYRDDVDWLQSAVFDTLVLGAMQEYALTAAGARAMHKRIQRDGYGLGRALRFRMLVKGT